jgi:hypothetical protein
MTDELLSPMVKPPDDHPYLASHDQMHNDYFLRPTTFCLWLCTAVAMTEVNTGKVTTVNDILGLGPSTVSLVSQLKNHKIITKCGRPLPQYKGGGLFSSSGEENVPSSAVPVLKFWGPKR